MKAHNVHTCKACAERAAARAAELAVLKTTVKASAA